MSSQKNDAPSAAQAAPQLPLFRVRFLDETKTAAIGVDQPDSHLVVQVEIKEPFAVGRPSRLEAILARHIMKRCYFPGREISDSNLAMRGLTAGLLRVKGEPLSVRRQCRRSALGDFPSSAPSIFATQTALSRSKARTFAPPRRAGVLLSRPPRKTINLVMGFFYGSAIVAKAVMAKAAIRTNR